MRASNLLPSMWALLVLSITCDIVISYKVKLPPGNAMQYPNGVVDPAERAVDGKKGTRKFECTHTSFGKNAWWQIKLLGLYVVDSVWLLNRERAPQRLSQFNISVGNQSLPNEQKLCRYYPGMVPSGGSNNISCDTRVVGTYVSVQKMTNAGGPYLSICEVEVYGYRKCQPGRFNNDCVPCNCRDACSLETGKCPSACLPGWFTDNCQRELPTVGILTPRALSSSSISVYWKSTPQHRINLLPVSSFVIQYRLKGAAAWMNQSVDIRDTGIGSVLNYTVFGLLPNEIYLFRVTLQSMYNGVQYDGKPSQVSSETKTPCGAPATPLIQRSWMDCDDKGRTVRIIVSWEELGPKSHGCNSYSRIEVLYFPTESPQSATVVRTKPQHKVVNLEVKSPHNSGYDVIVRVFNDKNMSADSLVVSAGTSRNSKCKTVDSVWRGTERPSLSNNTGPIIGSFIAGMAVVLMVFLVIFLVKRRRSGRRSGLNYSDKRHSVSLSGKKHGPALQNSNSKAQTGMDTYEETNLSSTNIDKRLGVDTGEHTYDKLDAEALSVSTYQNVRTERPRAPMYESLST